MPPPVSKPFLRPTCSQLRSSSGSKPGGAAMPAGRYNLSWMTPLVATFGEVMLRLSPPGFERILQSPTFQATFGGGEANVAVSVAQLGGKSRFITVLPSSNAMADGLTGELRRFGVDVDRVVYGPGRMGLYFVEAGANQRPSKVLYDREQAARLRIAKPGSIDWKTALEGVTWFHITGITPAISASARGTLARGAAGSPGSGNSDLVRSQLPEEPLEMGKVADRSHAGAWSS